MRLLVVDDDLILNESIVEGLRQEGFAVDPAYHGEEAEFLINANDYDCIVLDIMLPCKDGWSILQSMRRRGVKTPVVCLTARDSLDDKVKGLDLGADDYVVKPFAWRELTSRLRSVIRRTYGR